MKTRRILAPFIFASVIATVFPTLSANAKDNCSSEINRVLEGISLEGKTIKKSSIIGVYDNMRGGSRVSGFEGWFSFDQCKGNLVIVVDMACHMRSTYTRGNCEISGLKNY